MFVFHLFIIIIWRSYRVRIYLSRTIVDLIKRHNPYCRLKIELILIINWILNRNITLEYQIVFIL